MREQDGQSAEIILHAALYPNVKFYELEKFARTFLQPVTGMPLGSNDVDGDHTHLQATDTVYTGEDDCRGVVIADSQLMGIGNTQRDGQFRELTVNGTSGSCVAANAYTSHTNAYCANTIKHSTACPEVAALYELFAYTRRDCERYCVRDGGCRAYDWFEI